MPTTGTWGGGNTITYLHSKDEKRHCCWCIHYRKTDKYCYEKLTKCNGSSHCSYYKKICTNPEPKPPKPLDGEIISIDMKEIKIPKKYRTHIPAQKKLDDLIAHYNQHQQFDTPIIVKRDGDHFVLKDKYARYYAAKQLGLRRILAKIDNT